MRLYIVLFFLLFLVIDNTFSQQNVGIGTITPNPTSILDLESKTKGLLIPRMTTIERIAIANPANALTVFDTDCAEYWYYYESGSESGWVSLNNSGNKIKEVVDEYAVSICDQTIIANANTNAINILLPVTSISSNKGKKYTIKAINKNNAVTIQPATGQFVDGSASYTFTTNYDVITIQSDGVNWWIISKN